jgi:hypothetical protein
LFSYLIGEVIFFEKVERLIRYSALESIQAVTCFKALCGVIKENIVRRDVVLARIRIAYLPITGQTYSEHARLKLFYNQ